MCHASCSLGGPFDRPVRMSSFYRAHELCQVNSQFEDLPALAHHNQHALWGHTPTRTCMAFLNKAVDYLQLWCDRACPGSPLHLCCSSRSI